MKNPFKDQLLSDYYNSSLMQSLMPNKLMTALDSYHNEQIGETAHSFHAGGAGTCQAW